MDAKDNTVMAADPLTDGIDHREQFLDEQHNCPLCGSEMLLTHVTQFVEMRVQEHAECEACKIQVRDLRHHLQ